MSQGTDAQIGADGRRILGSAEPLTPEQRKARLRELAGWGVDLSLSSVQIGKTPAECLEEWQAFYEFAEAARRAVSEGRVYPHRPRRVGTETHEVSEVTP